MSASSISLTKRRLPPTSDRGASCSRSPDVRMTTMRQGGPPEAVRRSATACACQSASWLPRVPIRSSRSEATSAGAASAGRRTAGESLHAPRPAFFGVPVVPALGLFLGGRTLQTEQAGERVAVEAYRLCVSEQLQLFGG